MSESKKIFNLPNILTLLRIAVIPLIMVLMHLQGRGYSQTTNLVLGYVAAFFFLAAAISDLVDGYFARKYNMVSLIGKLIDPMADKLVHMAVMVMFIPLGVIPAWLVVLHLFREISITGIRSVAAGYNVIMSADSLGKKKTVFLNCALTAFLLGKTFLGISSYTFGWFCLIVATVLSLISGCQYLVVFYNKVIKV